MGYYYSNENEVLFSNPNSEGKETPPVELSHRGIVLNSGLKGDKYGMWLRKKSNGSMYRLAQTL